MSDQPPTTPPPLEYAHAYTAAPEQRRGVWRRALWVPAVLVILCLLFMLLRGQNRAFTTIPYSEFDVRLKVPGEISAEPDKIEWLKLSGDALYGRFVRAEEIPERGAVTYFKVVLPAGMGSHYPFFRDLVDRAGLARVDVESSDSLVVNILLPLIPWLLIFGFIYFFVFRPMTKRSHRPGAQFILSGPGRWIPDPPALAAAAK